MPSPSPSDYPAPLARFPVEIRDAYARVMAAHDPAALRLVIEAALRDYMPKASAYPRTAALRAELRLVEDLSFDSLAIAETVFFFEDLFQVRIENQDILALHTVGDLQAYVLRKLEAGKPLA